jgi:Cft2 family RNA processing exonuclease
MQASGSSSPATTSAGRTRPARRSSRCPCDIFITEATFGLPVFRHPATRQEIDRLLQRLHDNPDRCVLVGAYALGKAQR